MPEILELATLTVQQEHVVLSDLGLLFDELETLSGNLAKGTVAEQSLSGRPGQRNDDDSIRTKDRSS
jgi:hypothetical protein